MPRGGTQTCEQDVLPPAEAARGAADRIPQGDIRAACEGFVGGEKAGVSDRNVLGEVVPV